MKNVMNLMNQNYIVLELGFFIRPTMLYKQTLYLCINKYSKFEKQFACIIFFKLEFISDLCKN